MATLLCIDTATPVCSVAIAEEDIILCTREHADYNSHARELTILISACCEEAGLKLHAIAYIVVNIGPGSFTGLRIGVSAAKGLAYALGKPIMAVPSLLAIAYQAASVKPSDYYLSAIEARHGKVFAAMYDRAFHEVSPPSLVTADEFVKLYKQQSSCTVCANFTLEPSGAFAELTDKYVMIKSAATLLIKPALMLRERQQFADLARFEPMYIQPFGKL
ncbi:MAG: tRNA (adenosine(37)-N6)-threonylcarbamoyltransferase complex dimerization subunit type 1 TsaB [Chitinophagales bacterium]|nr:tRNA (adenosine(37)-N6)-threonylcarbamoyltransferase complex dimerization subunit type 1 TsaB [Chitinophagales bacterium]MDW8418270.1 tRNA (adenosine(37)-N6)-threonylcarbamoyltransferase complex dimerization subunit type 1 TsaB [Chitinophagales bacterium]